MWATRRGFIRRRLTVPCAARDDAKESAAFAEAVGEDRDRGDPGVSVRIRGDEEGCADDHRREPIVDETIRS